MRRRRFLSLAGAVPIAALPGNSVATSPPRTRSLPGGDRSQVEPAGSTPTPTGDVLVEQVPAELVEYERFGETNLAVRGVLRNTSARALSYVEANARFLDGESTIVGEGYSNIAPLLPGRGWKYNVDYYSEAGVPASEVEAYEFSAGYTEGDEPPNSPDLEVVESEMLEVEQFGEQTKVVQGTIRNVGDSTLDYVEAGVHFLDGDDVVIGDFFSNTGDLRPGQGWKFQVDYYSETDTPASEAVAYDLFATT